MSVSKYPWVGIGIVAGCFYAAMAAGIAASGGVVCYALLKHEPCAVTDTEIRTFDHWSYNKGGAMPSYTYRCIPK